MSSHHQQEQSARALHRPLFLWSMPFIFLYFGLPIISKAFGASALEIGGLFSVFSATTLVIRPMVGWTLDRSGRKSFFVLALFLYALAMAAFAFAESMTGLYLARLFQGVGSAFLWTAANTIVADLTPAKERGEALGALNEITMRGGLIGALAASMIMSMLPEGLGWKTAFSGFAILTLAAAFLAWKVIPNTKPALRTAPTQTVTVSGGLIKLLLVVFITGVPEAMLSPIYMTYLQDKFTTDPGILAWAFFPAGLVAAFFSARLGGMSDRFGRIPMMALGLAGAGIISIVMPHLPSVIWLAVLYTASAVMSAISEPAETAMVADLTGHEKRGLAYGLYDFVENLGFTLGPLVGGLFYDVIGSHVPFYLNGIFLLIGAVLTLALLRKVSMPGVGIPFKL